MNPRAHRSQRGVTLIELAVVVMILAIMAGIAGIPAGPDSASIVDMAEIQVQDAFAMAQTMSYSLGVPHGVVFDVASDRFAVVAQAGDAAQDPLTHGEYVIDFNEPGQTQGVNIQQAEFGATGAAGIFDAQGAPITGGLITLMKGDVVRSWTLDAATGKLELVGG